jgi:sulfide:quinone oxidoreductase
MSPPPVRILIAGGGVAGLEALLALRRQLAGLVELAVIAPDETFTYRPLTVAQPFTAEPVPTLKLADVLAEQGATHVRARLTAVDTGAQVAILDDGTRMLYDRLIVAVGAAAQPVVAGAIPLGGPADVPALTALVARVRAGTARRIALAVPAGIAWTLPLYELALQLGAEHGPDGPPQIVLVTAESEPLAAFGGDAALETRELLDGRGVELYTESTVEAFEDGVLWIDFEGGADVDALIALPRLRGPAIDGLPHNDDGFVAIDHLARVPGVEHVYAAGDACTFALKQGGIAAQEADVAAAHIAWTLGVGPRPAPLELVLRGELLTGEAPRFLRARVAERGEEHDPGQVSREALWWPPAKIAARELAPYLAGRLLPTANA